MEDWIDYSYRRRRKRVHPCPFIAPPGFQLAGLGPYRALSFSGASLPGDPKIPWGQRGCNCPRCLREPSHLGLSVSSTPESSRTIPSRCLSKSPGFSCIRGHGRSRTTFLLALLLPNQPCRTKPRDRPPYHCPPSRQHPPPHGRRGTTLYLPPKTESSFMKPLRADSRGILHFFGGSTLRNHPWAYAHGLLRRRIKQKKPPPL